MLMRDPNHPAFKRVFAEAELDNRPELDSVRDRLVGHFVWILILSFAILLRSSI